MIGRRVLIGGADLTIECVGSGRSLDDALRLTAPGGRVILLGLAGSFDGGAPDPVAEAMRAADRVGSLVVVPAGNDGPTFAAAGTVGGPASVATALVVVRNGSFSRIKPRGSSSLAPDIRRHTVRARFGGTSKIDWSRPHRG